MRAVAESVRRWRLDDLIRQMIEPGFAARFRCAPPAAGGSGHVDPNLLAVAPPRSRYVRRWRRHARHCPACAGVFRFLGLRLE